MMHRHVEMGSLCRYVLTEVAVDLDLHTGIRLIPQLELDAAAARSDGLADLRALSKLSSHHKELIFALQCSMRSRSAPSGYMTRIACRCWVAASGLCRLQQHASAGPSLCRLTKLAHRCSSVRMFAQHCVGSSTNVSAAEGPSSLIAIARRLIKRGVAQGQTAFVENMTIQVMCQHPHQLITNLGADPQTAPQPQGPHLGQAGPNRIVWVGWG